MSTKLFFFEKVLTLGTFEYSDEWNLFLECLIPFISNADCDVGGACEGDVVDGVDQLGEQQDVDLTL